MAKRFTDNEKWKDAWFMDLPSKYKLFWLYLLDECNHAGIWKVNFKVASFHIGEHLEHSEVNRIMKERITILDNEYWYINKFIKYQYKCEVQGLNAKNKAHLSVLKILDEYDYFKPLTSPLLGVKDKDKDKDKDIFKKNKRTVVEGDDISNIETFDTSVFRDIKILRDHYLVNLRLRNAFCDNAKVKITNEQLPNRLNRFQAKLESEGRTMETFLEYAKYFKNWHNSTPMVEKKTDSAGRRVANYSNPVI